jgi:D-alanyl-D-alanine dipeptidase/L,D-peptidoglycan transpeptidase YkuD (ErfK/YbiS/YcfS/YnhG family)
MRVPIAGRTKLILCFLLCWGRLCGAYDVLAGHQQAIVVITHDWNAIQGSVQLFERSDDNSAWIAVGRPMPAVVGRAGLAWGIGLHPPQNTPREKEEGDKRTPAGIFSIGTAFGFAPSSKLQPLRIEYLQLDATSEAINDSRSAYYNTIVNTKQIASDWNSSEKIGFTPQNERGFVIHHNFPNPKPMCGSAIFFHLWWNSNSATAGCTATSGATLSTILSWLDRTKDPVLVQLPSSVYHELLNSWMLPPLSVAAQSRLVDIATVNPDIVVDIRYATSNNFMGFPLYPKAVCFLNNDVAEALNDVQHDLAQQGLKLKIFDGYRPLSVQQLMWESLQDERYVANPQKNKGRHTRGMAVDVTLVDCDGHELEMPSAYDEFSERAHSDYANGTETARRNHALLRDVMIRHHFHPLATAWWQFDFEGWKDDIRFPSLDISFDELSAAVAPRDRLCSQQGGEVR